MAQFCRPDTDTNNVDAYTDQGGGSTTLYTTIDETSASDADYVRTVTSPSSDVIVFRLSDVTDPALSTGHIMRFRCSTDVASGGETLDFTLQLRQGYTNEGSQGTLIATKAQTGVSGTTWVDVTYTLSGAEADAITDYTALFYRLLINKP
jgi:hypothetical protein